MAKCTFKGCSHEQISKGLCTGHYTQQYRNKPLTELKLVSEKIPVVNGKKACRQCKKNKPISEFYNLNKKGKLSVDCKPCYIDKVKKRRG